ncbi:MAG: HAD family hydrolase [Solirubrobacteraceae bacterium]
MQRSVARPRRALLIDGMGTLVALAPPAPRLVAECKRRFGASVSEAQAGQALHAEIGFYRAHMGEGRDAASLGALRRRCAEVLREVLPAQLRDCDLHDALLASLRFDAYADARAALATARAHGARVVVVSNWDISLGDVIERVGLAPLVDAVVTSAAVGAAEPDPAIFGYALKLAGVEPERARHVGDSLTEDVAGARAAGIEAVLLCRDGDRPAGVATIAGLDQLSWPEGRQRRGP